MHSFGINNLDVNMQVKCFAATVLFVKYQVACFWVACAIDFHLIIPKTFAYFADGFPESKSIGKQLTRCRSRWANPHSTWQIGES